MKQKFNTHNWQNTVLQIGSTIQQAISCLDKSSLQIVLVVSEEMKLLGTLTDGDIRRAFLKGFQLDSVINDILHRNPLVVPPDIGKDLVLQLMRINKIRQLPIVDQESKVLGLHVWDSVVAPVIIENPMLIMAGGKGTRLRPHTENCPKPMLEVGGKPILEHIVERAVVEGFRNFIISLHYLGNMIEDHFGDGSRYGIRIAYLREDFPLGTAGCLGILPEIPKLPLIVTNGDVLTNIQYKEFLDFHNQQEADATMAVRHHEIQNQFGVVRTNGIEIEGFEEKPVYRSHVNAGIYVLKPNVLNYLVPNQHCDMPTLFQRVKANSGRAIVYPMHESWLDVGRPTDLLAARNSFEKD